MSRGGSKHQTKSRGQKDAYAKYIRTQAYEPTVDDQLPFGQTNQPGEELAEPTSKRRRPLNTKERFRAHFTERWLEWILGLIAIVLSYFLVDSKVELAKLSTSSTNQESTIKSIQGELKQNVTEDHKQDLQIRENTVRIELLHGVKIQPLKPSQDSLSID